ncbi:hypothetical protein [Thermococcus sp. MV11]|uniref:hypothetical protein n=1 Tax=Thermococcus sp. MV11 TaxID=1638267 RepID=UPI00352F7FFB
MDGLLDTNVVIGLFGGNRKVVEALYREGAREYHLPTIVLFELHCGHLKERGADARDDAQSRVR